MQTLTNTAPDPLASLNDAQREAVLHGVDAPDARPLLILAGAGTGKTQTLAHRVAALLRAGAQPQRLLLLTFSRRAADELAHRALAQLRVGDAAAHASVLPWAGTFHAIGARLLREAAPRIGLDAGFTILDRSDAEDLLGLTRQEIGLGDTTKRFPKKGTLLAIYSRVVNAEEPLDAVLARQFPWCAHWAADLRRLFAAYVQAKAEQNVLDYDDLLLAWAELMDEPALAEDIASRFDHVLVDEYQDTNRLQARILKALKPSGAGLTVVGDDAQAIYGFRGATVRNILDFPAQFAAPARLVALERNYRSTQGILDVANAITERAAERHAKRLWTEQAGTRKPALVLVDDEATQARYVGAGRARCARGRLGAQGAGGAVSRQLTQRRVGA